jgi:hypothetical protein
VWCDHELRLWDASDIYAPDQMDTEKEYNCIMSQGDLAFPTDPPTTNAAIYSFNATTVGRSLSSSIFAGLVQSQEDRIIFGSRARGRLIPSGDGVPC